MTDIIRQENRADHQPLNIERKGQICPQCGSELVERSETPVISNYPAPQLEMLSCSSGNCSYRKYRKLESI